MSAETQPKQTTPDDAMLAALPGVSPAAVLEIMEDPTVAQPLVRGEWLVQFATMRKLSPTLTPAQRMQWMDKLEKIGGLIPTQQETNPTAGLPQIIMVFPKRGEQQTLSAPVIDVGAPADE